ncbi:TetR family transcriptional regulator [Micromonospora sp. HUAS LYJ1]|uniref:acyl-CoA-like ligand-binding transcription factor n=1 Tax=Micromonospora sp. HUAS LYJ1 TaxID=3061626 RepID=UPI0026716C75|nr:TetR family transcriptional regulator [Micromonospora sp. HUAS LYJ1]WKU06862.1 TetR family transcriptional regulator [Micromonospora sp. HUAS LYJ1]
MSGLRERKKVETRTALSWAAIRLTVARGFDNVLVEDIAQAVGVSPRTFNNYFSSKAEAIAFRHLDRSRRVAEALRRRPADEPLWAALIAATLTRFAPGPEVTQSPPGAHAEWVDGLAVMLAEPALQAEMLRAGAIAEADLAAAVAERTGTDPDRDLYPHLVAASVNAAVNAAIRHYLRADPPVAMEHLLPDALTRLAAGLPPPTPR